jgi:DNA-binding transcriptional MerR regulator
MESGLSDSKLYYSMGEIAEKYQVKHSLIRYWEKEFDIIKPKKNKKGNRLFTKKDLEAFDLIFDLVKNKGYTLDGAKQKIKEGKTNKFRNEEIVSKLKTIKSFLLELDSQLDS